MAKCVLCGSRVIWKDDCWKSFNLVKNVFVDFRVCPKKCVKSFGVSIGESIGEWRKRLGIKRIKKKNKVLVSEEKVILEKENLRLELEKKQLESRWASALVMFRSEGVVSWGRCEHFGKLRGKHIAIVFNRDLKKLGISSRLRFKKDLAIVESNGP